MENRNEKLYYSPLEFIGSDAAAIQAAVSEAQRTDIRTVLIPAKEDGSVWKVDTTIQVPGDMTIILNGCKIEATCTAFTNSGAKTRCLAGEQHKIFLLGRHGACITAVDTDEPQIVLGNVRDCRVAGITFAGGGGLKLDFVQYSKIQQLQFDGSRHGVVFTEGCNNIILESVEAITREEAVLARGGGESYFGRDTDLYNSILCRIQAVTCGAPAVALYAGKVALYNVVVRDVTDLTEADGVSVRIGDPCDEGSIRDITVRGVDSRRTCVETGCSCDGMFYSNLRPPQGVRALTRVAPNTRELLDQEVMEIVLPQFDQDKDAEFLTPNAEEFLADGDAQTIQNAIDAAALRGINCVVIPRWNVRTQSTVWNIEQTIQVPSYMTVVMLNSYLRLADFMYGNMFTNTQAYEDQGRCIAREEHDIAFIGIGDAVLDGGTHNGLLEKTCFLNGFPDKRYNATVLFNNVRNMIFRDVQMRQSRWYGMYFIHCDTIHIANIDFDCWEDCCNRDCVDMRQGCHNFLIENITGASGDDVIAMNNLGNDGNDGRYVPGKDVDTMNMVVRNIKADARRWFTVRLLDQDRHLEQYITLDTIMDVSRTEDKKRCQATIMVGSHEYHYKIPGELGDLAHLTIRDIYSRSTRAISFGGCSDDVQVSNVHAFDDTPFAIAVSTQANLRDVHINGVFYKRNRRHLSLVGTLDSGDHYVEPPAGKERQFGTNELAATVNAIVLDLTGLKSENFVVENLFVDFATTGVSLSGGGNVEVRNLNIANLTGRLAKVDASSTLTINGKPLK